MAKAKDVELVTGTGSTTDPIPPVENPPAAGGVTAGSTPPQPPQVGDTSEVDALRAQIADLQAKLADTRAGAIDPLGPMKKFRVEVKDAPTWIVEAPHATLAWGAYCTAVGVNNSQYTPSIVEVDLATELGRV